MGVQERRAREKDETRRKILSAASDLFVNEGIQSVSMRRIAEKIEYSPAAIYLYFKDKSELVLSICQETFAELDHRLTELEKLNLPPLEGFLRGCETYIRFGLEHPSHYIFTMCTPEENATNKIDEQDYAETHELAMRTFDHLRRCVRRCMDAGVFRTQDVETVSQMCWLSIHGVTAGLVTSSTFPFVDKDLLIRTHLETLARGLRA
ncbi:MAG: TetR/AcrR family transcriptional regulator [Bryobacteraceae bacterium]|nr:TetR/AcrR family transcriptional regulator [Bryobacteraceae bacterium]